MNEKQIREALDAARTFIRNGAALGFIRMPDADTPDSAHNTLPMIESALVALDRASESDDPRVSHQAALLMIADLNRKVADLESTPSDRPSPASREDLRDKWKIVDGDCREGDGLIGGGLITYHVDAFDEGWKAALDRSSGAYWGKTSLHLGAALGPTPDHPSNQPPKGSA